MAQTKNMTVGEPLRLIVMFTIPLMIGNVFLQFATMMEGSIVGRELGVTGVAALGATHSISNVLRGAAQGLSIGLPVITAQRFGAGDGQGVKRSVATGITLSALAWLMFSALFIPLWRPILRLMNTPGEVLDDAWIYLTLITAGLIVSLLHYLMFNIVRCVGDSKTPLFFQIITGGFDIALAYVFVAVFKLGVAGVPLAQLGAQAIGTALFLGYVVLIKKNPVLRLIKEDWRLGKADFSEHLKSGAASGLMFAVAPCCGLVTQPSLNSMGTQMIAGYTAAQQIAGVISQSFASIGQAMATFVGQNYGAGLVRRVHTGIRQTAVLAVVFSFGLGAVTAFFCKPMVTLYMGVASPELLGYAQTNMNFATAGWFLLATIFVFRQSLQALNSRVLPIFGSGAEILARGIAVLTFIPRFGYTGLCFAQVFAWFLSAALLVAGYAVLIRRLRRSHPWEEEDSARQANIIEQQ